jgi:DNA-binding CsgD family transcriptional regulator
MKLKWERAGNRVFGFLALLLFFSIALTFYLRVATAFINIMFGFLTFTIVYSVITPLFFSRRAPPAEELRLILTLAVVTIILLPCFIILDFYYDYFPFIHPFIPKGFYTLPGFYLFWNISTLLFLSRQMGKSAMLRMVVDIPEGFIKKHDISLREIEVLRLLVQGNSYQDIGSKLFISPLTVKSHAIHIYQKTGVKNKMELIHLIGKNTA